MQLLILKHDTHAVLQYVTDGAEYPLCTNEAESVLLCVMSATHQQSALITRFIYTLFSEIGSANETEKKKTASIPK